MGGKLVTRKPNCESLNDLKVRKMLTSSKLINSLHPMRWDPSAQPKRGLPELKHLNEASIHWLLLHWNWPGPQTTGFRPKQGQTEVLKTGWAMKSQMVNLYKHCI